MALSAQRISAAISKQRNGSLMWLMATGAYQPDVAEKQAGLNESGENGGKSVIETGTATSAAAKDAQAKKRRQAKNALAKICGGTCKRAAWQRSE
jgi:hypothetical protein